MHRTNRIWEIDFIRGIAVILMIIFHFVLDTKEELVYTPFWYYIGKVSAILFILVSGISSTFCKNNLIRGLQIFGLGLFLTLVTYLIDPRFYIKFGILHFLGVSTILSYFIERYLYRFSMRYWASASIIILFLGNILSNKSVQTSYLFPIGFTNNTFSSLDYYPMLPWYGVFLIGVIVGKTIYKNKKGITNLQTQCKMVLYLGRNSLVIYLIHQPIILGLLKLFQ